MTIPSGSYPDTLDSRGVGAIPLEELNLQGPMIETMAYKQIEVTGTEALIRQEQGTRCQPIRGRGLRALGTRSSFRGSAFTGRGEKAMEIGLPPAPRTDGSPGGMPEGRARIHPPGVASIVKEQRRPLGVNLGAGVSRHPGIRTNRDDR